MASYGRPQGSGVIVLALGLAPALVVLAAVAMAPEEGTSETAPAASPAPASVHAPVPVPVSVPRPEPVPVSVPAPVRTIREHEHEQALARTPAPAPALASAPSLDPLALAHRHAPELRFNAWFPTDDPSPCHQNEDHYPSSVEGFLADLERGDAVVVSRASVGPHAAVARRVRLQEKVRFGPRSVQGYPVAMAGDRPGTAPTYACIYADPREPRARFVEYWSFYAYDRSDGRVAAAKGGLGGHRSDWEHISVKLDVDPAGASRITSAVYYGHEHAFLVSASELELVLGTHPVVYVAQGKHASYPEPGELRDYFSLAPLIQFDDVFHGNGARVRTWEAGLADISKTASPRPPWLEWSFPWGPDDERVLGVAYATSSVGPWQHEESHDRFAKVTSTWADAKATRGLRIDRAPAPRVDPPPVPVLDE